ncbi:heparinase [Fulvivirga sp. M361]|uniref:heparinase II/III domain-containing protein n=1 Tax=Fulvivirga sp. M361 TaxID=2594266 RepID=UPI00117BA252|nr:heparinase II/III family protein [Fulvivirga sp. M361]TRX62039.1 heparinase [Fulvivirga sp. M361]
MIHLNSALPNAGTTEVFQTAQLPPRQPQLAQVFQTQLAQVFQTCDYTIQKVLRTCYTATLTFIFVHLHSLYPPRLFKNLLFLICSIVCWFGYHPTYSQPNVNWQSLTERYTLEQLRSILGSPDSWQLYPKASDRAAWEQVPQYLQNRWIQRGEKALSYEWSALPATLFLDYARTGNRQPYSSKLYERRIKLRQLVLAECMENKGRFIDQIINGIWLICEETFWGIPAHIGMQKAGMGLPDVEEPVVDLFAAETAEMLAWSVYLLREQLDVVSPLIHRRVKLEAQRRILTPALTRDDFWWMGLDPDGEKVGNWNPWIASNWMATAVLLIDDKEVLADHISKILRVLDAYVSKNPSDGASDEGPHYWGHAAGSLFDALEILYSATNGKFNIYNDPLITQMGQYLNRMHINEQYYFNYADAVPYIRNNPFLIYHYGSRINDPSLMDLGAYLAPFGNYSERAGTHDGMGRVLREIFLVEEMQDRSQEHLFLRDVWMPVSQLMAARQKAGSSEGFFLGAKAGHNAEGQGHNHNDVGNFIVYYDGKPVIIDVGMATYNSKTFGPERYEIWNNQSAYHNLPTINGVMQQNGLEFKAENVAYTSGKRKTTLSMEIAGAYPPGAGLSSWRRSLTLDRKKGIILSDVYQLEKPGQDIQLSFMTICQVNADIPGQVRLLVDPGRGQSILVTYDPEKLSATLERLPLNTAHDLRIKKFWGEHMVRILFSAKKEMKEDIFTMHITKQ